MMLLHVFIYFLLGSVVGILSGLLGVGGGIIVVPALAFIFTKDQFPADSIMRLAVGTSLAIMVATTLRSLRAHLAYKGQEHAEFLSISMRLLPTVIVGVVLGAILAYFMHSNYLRIIFGIMILIIALSMLMSRQRSKQSRALPANGWIRVGGLCIGTLSGLLGVGGGATVIPYLLHFQVPMRVAVKVSIFIGVVVSIVGTLSYVTSGLHKVLPAHCLGYIYWPAWIGTGVGSVLCAPLGARLSYYLPSHTLRLLFAVMMIAIGLRMLFSA